MSIDEANDLYQQFYKEPNMGKTVTVEVELPEGYELAEARVRTPKRGDLYLDTDGQVVATTTDYTYTRYPILRRVRQEKTLVRPEWIRSGVKYLTHDNLDVWLAWTHGKPQCLPTGWVTCDEDDDIEECTSYEIPASILSLPNLPVIEGLPPAERIWRIVERGEG